MSLEQELSGAIAGDVRFDKVTRGLYSTDASVYRIEPAGVAIPRDRAELLRVLEICRRYRVPVTMRGGGTSQAGQAIGEGLQIDTSKHLNRLLEVNADERWARVEPGIVLDELNAQLAPLGLRFAPDISTASRATIGGMIANNSAGARSVLYGKTIDHVLEVEVALSDGSLARFGDVERGAVPEGESLEARCYRTVLDLAAEHAGEISRRFPKVLRRVAGYNLDEFTSLTRPVNLAKIIVGSEGTLAVVLEAKLRLVPLPKAKAVMVIEFAELLESLAATPVILGHRPSAIEVMDRAILDHTRQNEALDRSKRSLLSGDPASTLCVEFYADHAEELSPRLAALERDLRTRRLGYAWHSFTDAPTQARVWALREAALGLSTAMKGDAKSISFVEDTAVAPEKLRDYIERFLEIIHRNGTTAGIYAHASVGCLHVRPVVNLKTDAGVKQFEAIANEVADLVLEFGGALSGEHGDGLVRGPFMERMFGPVLYKAFREVKRTFDPKGLLNPGKIVDSPPLTANLRFGPEYRTPDPPTFFIYDDHGGFGRAVEMCSGVGACRKKLSGTMCPSYMATRDEAHSTRGRANALRLAMAGQLGEAGLTSRALYDVLDLCLECRACKAECPVGVDMARYKSEFLAKYWARNGTPLEVVALGNVHRIAPLGSRFASIANPVARSAAGRWLNEQLLGVDRRRKPPAWSPWTLEDWARKRPPSASATQVTVFADTFTNHYDPAIGVAAVELLESAGVTARVARPGCCARPLISKGLLAEAQAELEQTVNALTPFAGSPILVCEPSCLSSLKEDAPDLLTGVARDKARRISESVQLWEEYAAGLNLRVQAGPGRVLVHGHCHQKAMGLLDATMALLRKIPGAEVLNLDAGCCGMAGSFGYSKGHYEVSTAIAGRKLLPSIQARKPGDAVVAVGTSCRHQIADLAGAEAVHPAVLLRTLAAIG